MFADKHLAVKFYQAIKMKKYFWHIKRHKRQYWRDSSMEKVSKQATVKTGEGNHRCLQNGDSGKENKWKKISQNDLDSDIMNRKRKRKT